jgi:hypothetical protein
MQKVGRGKTCTHGEVKMPRKARRGDGAHGEDGRQNGREGERMNGKDGRQRGGK